MSELNLNLYQFFDPLYVLPSFLHLSYMFYPCLSVAASWKDGRGGEMEVVGSLRGQKCDPALCDNA